MRFTSQHQKIFKQLSHDRSPIHWNKAYANRTPMGEIVVYGIAGVIYGLGLWAKGRSFSLKKINGQFRRALYLDVEYDYLIEEDESKATIKLVRKDSVLMEYSFEWAPLGSWQQHRKTDIESQFIALEQANDDISVPADKANVDYHCHKQYMAEFNKVYPLDYQQLPFVQLLSMLWSSYQVGMVWPGNQALYTSFDFLFNAVEKSSLKLNLKELNYKLDNRFNMATIIGVGDECKLTMMAFFRPEAVNYSLEAIKDEVATDDSLVGKNVLVLGASRGFGSVLSRAILLKGATVAINYRTDGDEIKELRKQLSHLSDRVFFFKGDISRQADCNQLNAEVKRHLGKLDYLVCNASPPIMAYPFQEMDTEEFIDFVARSISVCHRPLLTLLPQLNEGATVINISSIYASQPAKQFSHYVTAKWSLEGMTHALASEFPKLNFVVARLPRMLTDQTNSNFDFHKKNSAITVASQLLNKMVDGEKNGNPFIIDFENDM